MTSSASSTSATRAGPLAGLRVVEFGVGTAGPYVAKLFADFGADVVKVETPDGDPSRLRGPFPGDRPDPEASGLFSYLNTNKLGIVIDPANPDDLKTLDALISQSDVFITNFAADILGRAGVAPAELRARYPKLLITHITPFGPDGPWSTRKGDELVTYAMGGMAYSTPGMPDASEDLYIEPPLHPGCFAAETITGIVAAAATMAAVMARMQSGSGNLVEVSQQAAVTAMQHRDFNNVSYVGGKYERLFSAKTTGRMPNFYLPCKDGYVAIPAPLEAHWVGLVEAMGNPGWAKTEQFSTGKARSVNCLELKRRMTEWTMTVTGDDLYALAQKHGLLVFPFHSVRKVVGSEQAKVRESTVEVSVGGMKARMPGAPFKLAATPWQLRRPAPRKGEHTKEILANLARDVGTPASPANPVANPYPLAGVTVLDLGQFIAVPFCTLWLAWLGANVIAIESRSRMTSRTAPPFAAGMAGNPDASGYFNMLYGSKKSCAVDMTTEAGRAVARRLAAEVDVMVDNFATGVLEKLGLGYDAIRPTNPDLIMLSCGAFGRSGPMKHARGLHSAVNLFSGVADVTGYPGTGPRILGGVLPDPFSGTYGSFAVMSALHHRHRTGEGQFIDLAMYEAMMTLIPEAVLDLSMNDRDPVRRGSRDRVTAPHGIYRCREDDTWVALSAHDETEWKAFCGAAGHPEWLSDPRFATMSKRYENVEALDAAIEAWTRTTTPAEITERLQNAGVTAGPVQRTDELLDDERLQRLGCIISTDHPVTGVRRQMGLPWRMDGARPNYRRAPLLGEHTREILTGLLGMDADEYDRLAAAGTVG
jgi:crotonobetainyl-CoA:carnitine CoA-transferase CaiB-like acyl-CoA transferase